MIRPMKSGPSPGQRAEELVARIFEDDGWKVEREPVAQSHRADLLVRKGNKRFLVAVKAFSEGRPDRVIPLLSRHPPSSSFREGSGEGSPASCSLRGRRPAVAPQTG